MLAIYFTKKSNERQVSCDISPDAGRLVIIERKPQCESGKDIYPSL